MSWTVWMRIGLLVVMACQAVMAQNGASRDRPPSLTQITLVLELRGDLSVEISSHDMNGGALDRIRRSALPCDWRPRERKWFPTTVNVYLDGSCRRYLASDGSSANGTLALAPIVAALRKAGAESVQIELYDNGHPLAEAPKAWHAEPYGPPVNGIRYWFDSHSVDELPQPIAVSIGKEWAPAYLGVPLGVTLLVPALLALWLRRRVARGGAN
jgi:hypothetical protein